jgi:hypothetical protein
MENYNYNYQSDFSEILTIEENKKRTFINALCITVTIKHAALELGKSEKCVFDFMGEYNITREHVEVMRKRFQFSGKKVKLQFIPKTDGKTYSYRKNPESNQKRRSMVQKQDRGNLPSQRSSR